MFCKDVLVNYTLNEPPYGQQKQTNRRNMLRKTSAMNLYNFLLTFAMIHRVEIAVLFISLERWRPEREQIVLDLTSDTSFTLEKLFLKRA